MIFKDWSNKNNTPTIDGTPFKESHDFSYYLKAYFEQTKLNRWTK